MLQIISATFFLFYTRRYTLSISKTMFPLIPYLFIVYIRVNILFIKYIFCLDTLIALDNLKRLVFFGIKY